MSQLIAGGAVSSVTPQGEGSRSLRLTVDLSPLLTVPCLLFTVIKHSAEYSHTLGPVSPSRESPAWG